MEYLVDLNNLGFATSILGGVAAGLGYMPIAVPLLFGSATMFLVDEYRYHFG